MAAVEIKGAITMGRAFFAVGFSLQRRRYLWEINPQFFY
jgi:hypothetical protein